MKPVPVPNPNTRFGIHYYPDTLHYRDTDLLTCLPLLKDLAISWIILEAPIDRAIPEAFLSALIGSGIEPVLHFHLPLDPAPPVDDLRLLFGAYSRWGVHYAILFDRPNARSSWPARSWVQAHLIERFLDVFLPYAECALQSGLMPVFPPLEPGGDFWDTAFLRLALQGFSRRGQAALLDSLVLSAYADPAGHPLSWGAGGPERWPQTRPYITPADSQDQRGFHVYDWYQAAALSVRVDPCPILLLGVSSGNHQAAKEEYASRAPDPILAISRLLEGEQVYDPSTDLPLDPLPEQILSCSFRIPSALEPDPEKVSEQDQQALSALKVLRKGVAEANFQVFEQQEDETEPAAPPVTISEQDQDHPIHHYLLLPAYEWGVSDWHLEIIRPYIKKHRPTIGFSLTEAAHAERVTLIGGSQSFPEKAINDLRQAGCQVEQIHGDGTNIATVLAER